MSVTIDRELLKRAAVRAFWVFLALRIATLVWMGILTVSFHQLVKEPDEFCKTATLLPGTLASGPLLEPWMRWDTICYLNVAEAGYISNPALTTWPPLYPLLTRFLMVIAPPSILSALLISSISTWAAFFLLYLLVTLDHGEKTASGAVFLTALFPFAFFLVAAYTESLFLALALGSLLCMRHERWGWAGLLAAFAALTRNQGIVLAAVLIWEGLAQYAAQPRNRLVYSVKILLSASLPVVAFGAYAAYVHYGIGADWPWQTLAKYWGQYSGWPWQGVIGTIRALAAEKGPTWFFWAPTRISDVFFAIVIPLVLVINRRQIRPSYQVFAWLIILIGLTKLSPGDVWLSFSRYMLPVFPFFIAVAPVLEKRLVRPVLFSAGVMLQGLLLGMFYLWLWAG